MIDDVQIPRFITCSRCGRSLNQIQELWADLDKRICKCCECNDYKELITCKRVKCNLHKYINDDFIIELPKVSAQVAQDESSEIDLNSCYCCKKDLPNTYCFMNFKVTKFNQKGDIIDKTSKIKVKICETCMSNIFSVLPFYWDERYDDKE